MRQDELKLVLEALEYWDVHGKLHQPTEETITAIKEALAQPEQEPRNVRERWNVELDGNDLLVCFNDHEKGDKCQYERYSPQRTWVGLTEEEIDDLRDNNFGVSPLISAVEAKLKQKNGYAEENT